MIAFKLPPIIETGHAHTGHLLSDVSSDNLKPEHPLPSQKINEIHSTSSRPTFIHYPGASMVKNELLDTAKAALRPALEVTKRLLDGFPGAKGTIAVLLQIINEAQVCTEM